MPRRRFECSKGIQGRETTRHWETSYSAIASTYQKVPSMSFNHATHPFYPFVETPQSAENRRFLFSLTIERDDHAASSAY
ncbi:hypothetical protein PGR6_56350 [Pseudomonas sp. GR 6-02]|nr:hypothetical protein PGR6_56350 [Pseudomonas sp. GR 6-02]